MNSQNAVPNQFSETPSKMKYWFFGGLNFTFLLYPLKAACRGNKLPPEGNVAQETPSKHLENIYAETGRKFLQGRKSMFSNYIFLQFYFRCSSNLYLVNCAFYRIFNNEWYKKIWAQITYIFNNAFLTSFPKFELYDEWFPGDDTGNWNSMNNHHSKRVIC